MKWMNINYLKQHSRIDYDCEDALLEQYGTAAEGFCLDRMGRTYENLLDIYGEIPARLYECVQLLVDNMYQYRTMVSMNNMSIVPYTFESMIANFMRHTKETPIQNEKDTLMDKLGVLYNDFLFATRETETTTEMQAIYDQFKRLWNLYNPITDPTPRICAELRKSLTLLTAQCDPYVNPEVNPNT